MTTMGRRQHLRLALVATVALLASGCDYVVRLGVTPSGGVAQTGSNFGASFSADGRYVAFTTLARDLLPGGYPFGSDVVVRDLRSGVTSLVSVAADGGAPNGSSSSGGISADGRFVVFTSSASNLVPGDTNGIDDVFVRDRQAGTTTRVDVDSSGGQANLGGSAGDITPDARFVAFVSTASNLVPNDNNDGNNDVFVRDRLLGTTTRVSVDTAGGDSNAASTNPSISADGRFVAFESAASDLVANDSNGAVDVFVRDRRTATATTTRISTDATGGDANDESWSPSISADGRFVAFQSSASDLAAGDDGLSSDIYVRDRQTGGTTRASVDAAGGNPEQNSGAVGPSISADGRFVAFTSSANDLVPGDDNGMGDVFVRDLQHATTTRVSVNASGEQIHGEPLQGTPPVGPPSISADGRYVAFYSLATDLLGGDQNPFGDVFVRAVPITTVTALAPSHVARDSTTTLAVIGTGFLPGAQAAAGVFGPGGVHVQSVQVTSPTTLELTVSVDQPAPTGPRTVVVWNPGTGPGATATSFGVCTGCLVVT
jgi:Tol biopolymer transport system component